MHVSLFPIDTFLCMASDLALAMASSTAVERPNATSLTTANFKCVDALEGAGGGDESTSTSQYSPCSGSVCLDGDLGVYCQCYYPKRANSDEVRHSLKKTRMR